MEREKLAKEVRKQMRETQKNNTSMNTDANITNQHEEYRKRKETEIRALMDDLIDEAHQPKYRTRTRQSRPKMFQKTWTETLSEWRQMFNVAPPADKCKCIAPMIAAYTARKRSRRNSNSQYKEPTTEEDTVDCSTCTANGRPPSRKWYKFSRIDTPQSEREV